MASDERWERLLDVFGEASEFEGERRAAYLDGTCAGDVELRAEVERMLAADEAPDFLEPPTEAEVPGELPSHTTQPERVGSYEIVRTIARGGMGIVYEAVQQNPRRRVALKMLLGGVLESVARRFRHEAAILARLHHPAIAQVYEAGLHGPETASTPYFAMEYVEGSRDIVSYAAEQGLSLRRRLQLFNEVSEAVHYGHEHGVIHRDLKPSNILVDGQGHAKVIDFGVARSTNADLTLQTLATRTGELVGTLWYMSPEQLEGNSDAIDPRCDVYALGIVLYHLLCGRHPYDLEGASMATVAHVIRDVAPTDPRRAAPGLPEELCWITLRALEKERERRYPSASALAADIDCFLEHEPVLAGPPSAVYRLRKFVRRHRVLVGTVAVVLVALLSGVVIATSGLVRAADEADKFKAISSIMTEVLVAVQVDREGRQVTVAELLDRAAAELGEPLDGRPEVEAALRLALAESYASLALHAETEEQAQLAVELLDAVGVDDPNRLRALSVLVEALLNQDDADRAQPLIRSGLDATRHLDPAHPLVLAFRGAECKVLRRRGHYAEALAVLRELHATASGALGPRAPETLELLTLITATARNLAPDGVAESYSRELVAARLETDGPEDYRTLEAKLALATLLVQLDELDEADELYAEALNPMIRLFSDKHPRVLTALNEMAVLHLKRGEHAQAISILEEVVAVREKRDGPEHNATLIAKGNLGTARTAIAVDGGIELQREVYETRRRLWGPDHPHVLRSMHNFALELVKLKRAPEAEPILRECLERRRALYGDAHKDTLESIHALAYMLYSLRRYGDAKPLLRAAWRGNREVLGEGHEQTLRAASNYVVVLGRLDENEEAIPVATEIVAIQRKRLAPDDPNLVIVMGNLASLYRRSGSFAQAESLFREILEHAQTHMPPEHKSIPAAFHDVGVCLQAQDRAADALPLLEEAVAAAELNTDVRRANYAAYRQAHGVCLRDLERFDEARQSLTIAYESLRALGAPEANDVVRELVGLYEVWEQPAEAARWRAKLPEDDG
ncbi:MAG: serine/threonine protein kinase [bacterium]|nr:serine/threonine protein kinase [bacterium]